MTHFQLEQDQLSEWEQPVRHTNEKSKYTNRQTLRTANTYLVSRNGLTITGSLGSINSTLETATGVWISPVIVGCKDFNTS
jgi:hypothetical protein